MGKTLFCVAKPYYTNKLSCFTRKTLENLWLGKIKKKDNIPSAQLLISFESREH